MGRRIRWLAALFILSFALVMVQLVNVEFRRANALATNPNNPRIAAQRLDRGRGDILAADGTVLAESVPATAGSYKYQRVYPETSLFAQVVGYDSHVSGTTGVEREYDRYLAPHTSMAEALSQLLRPPAPTTDDVTLTLVPALQRLAANSLAGRDGSVVLLNPVTGAVEAMYSNPSFDPNGFASPSSAAESLAYLAANQKDADGFRPDAPLATQTAIFPGSTFKVVTTAAAYDHQPQLAARSYPSLSALTLPSGTVLHNDTPVPCGGTVASMLPVSCDTGYAQLGMDLGAATLSGQAEQFGFNQVPPLDLPDVAASIFPADAGSDGDRSLLADSALGQYDVQATTLQMALVAAGIAHGGVIMTPHVLAQVRDGQGNLVTAYHPTPWKQATSRQAASQLTQLMQSVVTRGTADTVGFAPNDQVAAKTGTAQSGDPAANTHDWMIAFAPASHPRVAVAVAVPYQSYSASGAAVAGPIAKVMIEAALAATPQP